MRSALLTLGICLAAAVPAAAQSMGGGGGGGAGGGMSTAKMPEPPSLEKTRVRYHPQAKIDVDGKVSVKFIVDTAGNPEPNSIEIQKVSDSAFVEAARMTVLSMEYRPAEDHGQKMRSYATTEIRFKAGKTACDVVITSRGSALCVDSLAKKK